jgi:hypothetical protein
MGNMVCGKSCGSHLIKQREKSLEVVAIDNCDIGIFSQRFGGGQTTETRTKNYDPWSCGRSHRCSLGSEL